jgi:hypothetical protein
MNMEPVKYFSLLLAAFVCVFAHLAGMSMASGNLPLGDKAPAAIGISTEAENGLCSITQAPIAYGIKWAMGMPEFEQKEENESESSKEDTASDHPFATFLASSFLYARCSQVCKCRLDTASHFTSTTSRYLLHQVFRL